MRPETALHSCLYLKAGAAAEGRMWAAEVLCEQLYRPNVCLLSCIGFGMARITAVLGCADAEASGG